MSKIVVLDSGPLGMVTNPRASPENNQCKKWLASLLAQGVRVAIPEIADYEIRRELLRGGKMEGVARLDALEEVVDYIPITTPTMHKAAEFWAAVRRQGKPTADDKALDSDVILAAQAVLAMRDADEVVIATTNVQHLELLVEARIWQEIS